MNISKIKGEIVSPKEDSRILLKINTIDGSDLIGEFVSAEHETTESPSHDDPEWNEIKIKKSFITLKFETRIGDD